MIEEIIEKRRSIRQYLNKTVERGILKKIVKCGRFYPSRGNKQPLKYILVDDEELCKKIFENILWGSKVLAYRKFSNPEYSPKAYILVLIDKNISSIGYEYELGAAIENMLLCATENQLGSVWIKSMRSKKIKNIVNINDNHIEVDSVIALGYAKHSSIIVDLEKSSATIVDEHMNLIVPKRRENEIIFFNKYGQDESN